MIESYGWEGTNSNFERPLPPNIEIYNPNDDIYQDQIESISFAGTEIGNFENSELASTQEVADYLNETLPPSHLEGCDRIQYNSELNKLGTEVTGTFEPQNREISFCGTAEQFRGKEELFQEVTQGIGHNVYANQIANQPQLEQQWSQLYEQSQEKFAQDGTGFVSGYTVDNMEIDFAQTYTAYVHDPQKLNVYSPEKYEFMEQEVFNGRTYSSEPSFCGYYNSDGTYHWTTTNEDTDLETGKVVRRW